MLAVNDLALGFSFIIRIFNNREWALNIVWILDGAGQIGDMLFVEYTVTLPYGNGNEPACANLVECAAVGECEQEARRSHLLA